VTDQGGDAACWADRVCPACGMLDERDGRDGRCPHCGATASDDDPPGAGAPAAR
jgi:rubrerythrin